MNARIRLATALAAALLGAAPQAARAAAPAVEASVDRARVARGDEMALRIRLRGDAAQHEPDLAGLAADFDVQGVQQTQRTSIVNGVVDRSVDWLVGLVPRRAGALVIPALPVGSDATEPIPIEVTAGASGSASEEEDAASAEPVRVEVDADRGDPYEHERVLLRVRLLAGAEILDGALGEPEVPGAAVEQIGGDRSISQEIGGRSYRGIERTYAVVPDASGELALPQIRFEGHLAAPRPPRPSRRWGGPPGTLFEDLFSRSGLGNDFFGGFLGGRTLRVTASSQPLVLHVRPRPASTDGQWWLPARSLEVQETFEPATTELRVGEPLSRRIELRAEGVSPAQLPPLDLGEVPGVKQYTEAPNVAQDAHGSVRVQETTLIPTRAGTLRLPPVAISWWDTQADAPRQALLPAHELRVLPAAGAAAPPEAPTPAPAAQAAAPPEPSDEVAPASPVGFAVRHAGLLGACAALLAAALGLALRAAWRARHPSGGHGPSLRRAQRALRIACLVGDPSGAELALRDAARALDPGAAGFDRRMAKRLGGPDLVRAIAALHAARYSREADRGWDGRALWRSWRRSRRWRWRRAARPALPPLYPASTEGAAPRTG